MSPLHERVLFLLQEKYGPENIIPTPKGSVCIGTRVDVGDGHLIDVYVLASSTVGGSYELSDLGTTQCAVADWLGVERAVDLVDGLILGRAMSDDDLASEIEEVAHRCRDQVGFVRETFRREMAAHAVASVLEG